ncbi:MAG TPA: response regulator [Ktedonobacterales bacterium]|nr:response regulator [Ktedonobacterales bacterium]
MSSARTNSPRRRARPRAMMPAPHAHTAPISTARPVSHKSPQRSRPARATVTLLPRAAAPAPVATMPVEQTPAPLARPPIPEQAQPRILIVEDDLCAAHAIRDTLALEGEPDWNIQVAEGGERALALAAEQPPNVVLLDVGLPDLDGAEVYRRLRTHPRMGDTRVLFLTAATSLDLYQRGVDAGVMLRKPFAMDELVGLVRTLIAS